MINNNSADFEDDLCMENAVRSSFQASDVRFGLCVVVGSLISLVGLFENVFLISVLIDTKEKLSNSIFLLTVAIIDAGQEVIYLLLIGVSLTAEYFQLVGLYHFWGSYAAALYMCAQISPIFQTGVIIGASLDRYHQGVLMRQGRLLETPHAISQISQSHSFLRYLSICVAFMWAMLLKGSTMVETITVVNDNCTGFAHITIDMDPIDSEQFQELKFWLVPIFQFYIPFALLTVVNFLIVRQFKSAGIDNRKAHKNATCGMILLVSTYLTSNLLNVITAMCEQVYSPHYLNEYFSTEYTLASDLSSILVMAACASRLPTYYVSNPKFRKSLRSSIKKSPLVSL